MMQYLSRQNCKAPEISFSYLRILFSLDHLLVLVCVADILEDINILENIGFGIE